MGGMFQGVGGMMSAVEGAGGKTNATRPSREYKRMVQAMLKYFLPETEDVARDWLTDPYDTFAETFTQDYAKQLSQDYVAPLTEDQQALIAGILRTAGTSHLGEQHRQQVLGGEWLPTGKQYEPLMGALGRQFDIGAQGYSRDLQAMAGGSLFGAASGLQGMQHFKQQSYDNAILNMMGFERQNQMNAAQMGNLQAKELSALLPTAEIPRAIDDIALQRFFGDWTTSQQMEFMRGQSAFGAMMPPTGGYGGGSPAIPGSGFGRPLGELIGAAAESLNFGGLSTTSTQPISGSPTQDYLNSGGNFFGGSGFPPYADPLSYGMPAPPGSDFLGSGTNYGTYEQFAAGGGFTGNFQDPNQGFLGSGYGPPITGEGGLWDTISGWI